jgi:hypothetical protein
MLIYYGSKEIYFMWHWYDGIVELILCVLMIVAFCWDWKNIMQLPGDTVYSGVPNPFSWWLYLPAYICAVGYFIWRIVTMLNQKRISGL